VFRSREIRNSFWNLFGLAASVPLAFTTVPLMMRQLGTERFGLLTLAWTLIGHFSVFDLGLGKALTRRVADQLAAKQNPDQTGAAWTAVLAMVLLGLIAASLLTLVSPWLALSVLELPLELRQETLYFFCLISATLPCLLGSVGLRGLLEADQKFLPVAALRAASGLVSFGAPVVALQFSRRLPAVVAALALSRVLLTGAYWLTARRLTHELQYPPRWNTKEFLVLVRYGKWLAASNISGPLTTTVERVLIGGAVSAAAVAYFSTPDEIASKGGLVAAAVAAALFPSLAGSMMRDRNLAAKVFVRGAVFTFLGVFPLTAILVLLGEKILCWWLHTNFAAAAARATQWLAIGVFINSFVVLTNTLLRGAGRPDVMTKLRAAEMPFYPVLSSTALQCVGIGGAAVLRVVRIFLDLVVVVGTATIALPELERPLKRSFQAVVGGMCMLGVTTMAGSPWIRLAALAGLWTAAVLATAWIIGGAMIPRPLTTVLLGECSRSGQSRATACPSHL